MARNAAKGIVAALLLQSMMVGACAQSELPPGGSPVFRPETALSTEVGGLENTGASSEVRAVQGQPFTKSRWVRIGKRAQETNATQLTILNEQRIHKGDLLLAVYWLRGRQTGSTKRGQVEMMFEKATSPWLKSTIQAASTASNPALWKRVTVPFYSAEDYGPQEAMLSFRLAFSPQEIELGGITLSNYGQNRNLEEFFTLLGKADRGTPALLTLKPKEVHQTIVGLGGNFCQPRYGSSEAMDKVGAKNLETLNVAGARTGVPLNHWNPEPGKFREEGQASAFLQAVKILKGKGIPVIASVWEGPQWMLGGDVEQSGRVLPKDLYDDCIESLGALFLLGKTKYGAVPDYFSFNEPDYGVNFKFTPETQADFIRQASKAWAAKGLAIKFLIGDSANGAALAPYVKYLMTQADLQPVLGPIAFHCWDAIGASEDMYREIGELGIKHNKEIWCTEGGWDAQLWQRPNPWDSWENALGTAQAYAKTFRLTGASRLDYWTYQDNYPLVDPGTLKPFTVHEIVRQMEGVFSKGSKVIGIESDKEGLEAVATLAPDGAVSILLVNSGPESTIKLAGLPASKGLAVTTSTSKTVGQKTSASVDAKGSATVTLPTRSVVIVKTG